MAEVLFLEMVLCGWMAKRPIVFMNAVEVVILGSQWLAHSHGIYFAN